MSATLGSAHSKATYCVEHILEGEEANAMFGTVRTMEDRAIAWRERVMISRCQIILIDC